MRWLQVIRMTVISSRGRRQPPVWALLARGGQGKPPRVCSGRTSWTPATVRRARPPLASTHHRSAPAEGVLQSKIAPACPDQAFVGSVCTARVLQRPSTDKLDVGSGGKKQKAEYLRRGLDQHGLMRRCWAGNQRCIVLCQQVALCQWQGSPSYHFEWSDPKNASIKPALQEKKPAWNRLFDERFSQFGWSLLGLGQKNVVFFYYHEMNYLKGIWHFVENLSHELFCAHTA